MWIKPMRPENGLSDITPNTRSPGNHNPHQAWLDDGRQDQQLNNLSFISGASNGPLFYDDLNFARALQGKDRG
jgi:hypothetical protein